MPSDDDLTVEQRKLLAEYSSTGNDGSTISVQKIREIALKHGQDPDAAEAAVNRGIQKLYPDKTYRIQKWCSRCRKREEGVMYAGDLPTLEKFLDDQTKLHAHPHKVERKITKAPGERICDFHPVPY